MKQIYQNLMKTFMVAVLMTLSYMTIAQGSEDFTNFPETGSSYNDGSFTGNDGSTWTYLQSRGDQNITAPTPMLGRNRTPDAEMTSGTLSGGIGTLTFNYQQAFSSNVSLEVYVNTTLVATVTTEDEQNVLKSSGVITVEEPGDFTLSFKNPEGGQVLIDDVVWTSFAACTPPTTQASAVGTTVNSDTQITVNWTRGNGSAGVVVLAKEGSAVDSDPDNGVTYSADAVFGSGDEVGSGNNVVYVGTATSVVVTGLSVGTDYHFAVYEFNTTDACYLKPAATATATTTGNALPEVLSIATASGETTSDVILSFSEVINATDETGISLTIDGAAATISSVSGINTDTWTLTLSETIAANSGDILISYNESNGDLADSDGAALSSFTDEVVSNETTLNIVSNLSEARSLAGGSEVLITGEVILTYQRSSRNQKYIQDSGAGLLIDDASGNISTTYSLGDGISSLKGTMGGFNGVTQLIPSIDPGAASSTGNAIIPTVVSIADYNTSIDTYESRVLLFEQVSFENQGTAFDGGSDNYTVTDGVNDLTFRDNFSEVEYGNTMTIPYGDQDLLVLGAEFNGSGQVVPFTLDEAIIDNYAPEVDEAQEVTNITTGGFDVSLGLNEPASVYYIVNTNPTADLVALGNSTDFVEQTDPASKATINITGLDDNTEYFAHLLVEDANGNEQDNAITVSATTLEIVFDATSDIVAADAPIASGTISSTVNEEAEAVEVFNFKITDDGATDTEPTTVTQIVIENGNSEAWTSVLAGAVINDGTNNTAGVISDNAITFDLSTTPSIVPNSGELTFTLSAWLNTTQEDGTVLSFTVPTEHGVVSDASGSVIKATLDEAIFVTHTVDVEATTLALTSVPTTIQIDEAFGFTVSAEDANGNVDIAARSISVSSDGTGTLGGSISSIALSNGVLDLDDLTYDTEEDFVLTITDGVLSASTSSISAVAEATGTLFFSEYFEGSSNNKYLEIYNGTGAEVDLSTVTVKQSNNGSGFDGHSTAPQAYSVTLSGTLAAGEVYIIYNGQAEIAEILAEGDLALSYGDGDGDRVASFNGDDALGLFHDGVLVDLFGDPSNDPGSSWAVAGEDGATTNHTLVRKSATTNGNTETLGSFGTNAEDSEWIIFPEDDVTNIGFFGDLTDPLITVNTSDFDGNFGYVENPNSSEIRSYSVSALNLTADLVITAPNGFEMALNEDFSDASSSLTLTPQDGEVASSTIYVRFTPTSSDGATYEGGITHTSDGAESKSVTVSGIEGALTISSIESVRGMDLESLVKVTGVVIGGPNHGDNNRVIYDGTAGIVVFNFGGELIADLVLGDSIVVTGTLTEYNNLLEIEPTQAPELIEQGVTLPSPQPTPIAEVDDAVESELITIENVRFVENGQFAYGNFRIANDESDTLVFRLGSDNHPLVGTAIPTGYVNVTGVVGQFYDDYQLFSELASDIEVLPSEPSLTVTGADDVFDFGAVQTGETSATQSFTVAGENLSEEVSIVADANFEVSFESDANFESSLSAPIDQVGMLTETTVFVRFAPNAGVAGTINGSIAITSGDEAFDVTLTGVEESVTANKDVLLQGVSLYPNPARNELFIDVETSGAYDVRLITLQGAQISTKAGNGRTNVDLSNLAKGVYVVEVKQAGKVMRAKIVKQ
jgi:hypothetical protein